VTIRASPRSSTTTSRLSRADATTNRGERLDWAFGVVVLAFGTAIGFSEGGYFPPAWGWSAAAFLWIGATALFVRERVAFGRLERWLIGALIAFVGWVALSTTWSSTLERSILEAQRGLVYVGGLAMLFAVARRRPVAELLAAVWASALVLSSFALLDLFFGTQPKARSGNLIRLTEPLGYSNALALVAVLGILLGTGFAAHAAQPTLRSATAASVVVFALTIFFTFSRGAGIALAAGLVATALFDTRRLALLRVLVAVVPAAALAVWLGSQAQELTTAATPPSGRADEAHLLALATVALSVAAALLQIGTRRISFRGPAALIAAAAVLAVGAAGVVQYASRPTETRPRNRVTLTYSGRRVLWREALHDSKEHPLLGSGAGTFGQYWLAHRRTSAFARDAHSLYLETLAELGPVGLALLVAALAFPIAAAVRARAHPLVPAAFGAYFAYLLHAGGDWDWEMPAVTLLGLFCGASLVLAARPVEPPLLSRRVRVAALSGAALLALVAIAGLIGNGALAASERAAAGRHWQASESQARRATRWLPWSAEAWRRLAIAQSNLGDLESARASARKAVTKSSSEWRAWLTLMRLSTGRDQRRALREAARLNPRDPEVVQFRLAPGSLDQSWSYDDAWAGWPVAPVHRAHPIRAAFLDPRVGAIGSGGAPAYHFGVDIGVRDDRPEPGAPPGRSHRVYAIEGGAVELPATRARGPCVNGKVLIGHFSYWHVDAVVEHGQEVRPGQMIGWTCKGLWHVHLAEELELYGRRVYVNPIHPGTKLRPLPDDAPPRIRAIEFSRPAMPRWVVADGVSFPRAGMPFREAGGRAVVSGRVDVRARIEDPAAPDLPRPLASPSPPYRISLRVIRESDERDVLARTVFRAAVFLGDSLGTQAVPISYHYAPGTRQALPAQLCMELRRGDCGGVYWFRLFARPTSAYWDTTRLPDGAYRIRVTASDAAGNSASRSGRVTIRNSRTSRRAP